MCATLTAPTWQAIATTTLGKLAREAMFVPGSLSLTRLLAEFRARRMHMGIVADEFGGTDGLNYPGGCSGGAGRRDRR